MWQLSALASLFARAGQRVADKAALVQDFRVDSYIATFYRQFIYLFLICIVGYFGWMGEMVLTFKWQLVVYALVCLPSVFFYTHLLRKIEVTLLEAMMCLAPALFLFVDVVILHVGLTATQFIAIVILSLGGFAFVLNGRTHKLKKELTPLVGVFLAFNLFLTLAEAYTFKYLNGAYGTNGVSFYASAWLIIVLGVLLVIALKGKTHLLVRPSSLRYIPLVTVGKSLDAASGLFLMYALSLAAASQVAAIGALEPLVVFFVAVFIQKDARIRLREHVDSGNLHWKVGGVCLLVLGGFLIH